MVKTYCDPRRPSPTQSRQEEAFPQSAPGVMNDQTPNANRPKQPLHEYGASHVGPPLKLDRGSKSIIVISWFEYWAGVVFTLFARSQFSTYIELYRGIVFCRLRFQTVRQHSDATSYQRENILVSEKQTEN